MHIWWAYDTAHGANRWVRDTLYTHMIEPGELRCLVNLGLAYGSRGIHYSQLGFLPASYDPTVPCVIDSGRISYDYAGEWSPVGATWNDTLNRYDSIVFAPPAWMGDTLTRDVLHNFWTGWGVNQAQMRWLDLEWLPAIGAETRKLHWRDAYSLHYTVPQTYWYLRSGMPASRPLPATELVNAVRTVDRWGRTDLPMNTFAELAFYDTQRGHNPDGSLNPLYDTNHIFILNRRAFERSDDIDLL